MNWFLNLSTRAKLFLGFGVMVVFLGAVTLTAYTRIARITESQRRLYDFDFANSVDLLLLELNIMAERAGLSAMLLTTNRADQEKWHQEVKDRARRTEEILDRVGQRSRTDATLAGRLEELTSLYKVLKEARDTQVIPRIYAGKSEEAKNLIFGIQLERRESLRALAEKLREEAEGSARAAVAQSVQAAREAARVFLAIGALVLLMSGAMVILLNRIISGPLKEIAAGAQRIAVGDLSAAVPAADRRDEIGVLAQTFARMTESLRQMAAVAERMAAGDLTVQVKPQSEKDGLGNAFARMVQSLRKITSEILEGATVLASSAAEILAATTEVASGAAETATAVSQTTSTVEQVKQTAQLSAQKARYVSELAQKSAQVSQAGKKSVQETVEGMNRIREQMESVAESIVRLSEQSQAIGEIIAAVNDLAEQSNLLAVNAAIEAARAGEQGRGFAVVAQEVKSLAEQSKQATAQVRSILGDIQKATSAAVMATEQGSKSVEAGVKQSVAAGESVEKLAESIAEATQAATQIAASSQQQLAGIDQVVLAMENIKQATSQNVAGTKQAETAAQNLHQLGLKLKQLAEQYTV